MTDHTPKTARGFVETMLRSCIEADRLHQEHCDDAPLRHAESHAAVNGLTAALALETLRRFAPESAAELAEHLDDIFTAGDVGGPAYRSAKALGLDPDQWITDYEQRAAKRRQKATQQTQGGAS